MIDCPHWRNCGVTGGGCCALGKYNGKPSFGRCDACLGLFPRLPSPEPIADKVVIYKGVQLTISHRTTEGPKRWATLHRRAKAWDGTNPEAELTFIRTLADNLGLCTCQTDWLDLLNRTPPDLSSADTYWRWSVASHNQVNIKLGKPELAIDEAAII